MAENTTPSTPAPQTPLTSGTTSTPLPLFPKEEVYGIRPGLHGNSNYDEVQQTQLRMDDAFRKEQEVLGRIQRERMIFDQRIRQEMSALIEQEHALDYQINVFLANARVQ